MSHFEFDPEKSRMNLEKHGIDFVTAQRLWTDPGRKIKRSNHVGEIRYIGIGKIDDLLWTAIFTTRGLKIRLISVRRARDDEKSSYKDN